MSTTDRFAPAARALWAGRALLAALALLFALNVRYAVADWASLRQVAIPRGAAAPGFTAQLLDGRRWKLEDGAGHPTVLAFFATWCGPCRVELPELERLYRELAPTGVRFLAVNIEDEEAAPQVADFAKELGLTLPIAKGGDAIADRYHVENIPTLVVLDGSGKVRQTFLGPRGASQLVAAVDAAR